MITIRPEMPEDIPAIRRVNEQAFDRAEEADLVEALRRRGVITLSLVAVEDEDIIGHILFSPVTIESGESKLEAVALGPMAVLPSYQRQGIGSRLVRAGLEECRRLGHDVVIVLGHPGFYPRFGFVPSRRFGIRWEHDVPNEVFMVAELREGALTERGGTVRYQPEFASV
jgi:putative acetyltransferase